MANFKLYFPTLMKYEGGEKFTDRASDRGGATKWGMTLKTWIASGYDKDGDGDIDVNDLKVTTSADAEKIAKRLYWDKIAGDNIDSQSIAEFLFDWAYNSGSGIAVKKIQQILGLKPDGIMGPHTLEKINDANAKDLFQRLKDTRELYFRAIVRNDPKQSVNLNGWLNRNNSFKFKG